ncbi:MAG: hypothetical protein ACOC45_01690 [Alkalispirochaetaceae bacterium]
MRLILLDYNALAREEEVDLTPLKQLGELEIHEVTKPLESFQRVQRCDVLLTVAVPVSRMLLDWAPRIAQIVLLGGARSLVDMVAVKDLGVILTEIPPGEAQTMVEQAAEAIRRGARS